MTATMVESARKRWRINRENILPDFIAAFSLGVASIPESMASALLAGVSPGVMLQLEHTALLDRIGRENLFLAQRQWGVAAYQAYEAALAWLDEVKPQAQQPEGPAETSPDKTAEP